MQIKRHRRQLTNGEERTYIYAVSDDGEQRRSLRIVDSSVSPKQYRSREKSRIVAALQANSSLLVVGEAGCGKSVLGEAVAEELQQMGYKVAIAAPATVKQSLLLIAEEIGVDIETMEGKALTAQGLQDAIAAFLKNNTAFLIFDNAHRLQVSLRCWLEQLHSQGQPLVLLATFPPARDIFLKLPRIELDPLPNKAIREIMLETAAELSMEISPAQMAGLQQRCGGNPMLARRVIREEYLGLDATNPDHTQWIDGTPFLIAGLMVFTVVRLIGLGVNSTSLYLIGGILTVAVGVLRLILLSLPRKSTRLGQ